MINNKVVVNKLSRGNKWLFICEGKACVEGRECADGSHNISELTFRHK